MSSWNIIDSSNVSKSLFGLNCLNSDNKVALTEKNFIFFESVLSELKLFGWYSIVENKGRAFDDVKGDFVIRFMTSHPKDCSEELLKAMAECEKVEKHLHLPVQSGSSRVLKAMNRNYTREKYLELVEKAKQLMPDLTLTSDIIVGFPSETYEEVKETISLIEKVRYQSLFTFIYSKRKGTPAAEMPDDVSADEKGKRFRELLSVQEKISEEICKEQVGKTYRVLVEEPSRVEGNLYGRTLNNFIVEFEGEKDLIGKFVEVEITSGDTWIIKGKLKG